jgi:hypothetical protein
MKVNRGLALCTLISVILLAALLPGCIVGSGPTTTRDFDFSNFSKLEIGSAFEFTITQSSDFSVSLSFPESLGNYLDVTQTGDTVRVALKPITFSTSRPKAKITMPDITDLNLSGASTGKISGFNFTHDLNVEASGASNVNFDMQAGNTTFDVSGASRISGKLDSSDSNMKFSGASRAQLFGSAGNLKLDASGASNLDLSQWPLQDADVVLSGASHSSVDLSGTLDVNLSGASTLEYTGSPQLGTVNVTGASTLRKK